VYQEDEDNGMLEAYGEEEDEMANLDEMLLKKILNPQSTRV